MEKTERKNWIYEDYLKINDDKRYEVIEGVLLMNPAPSSKHQRVISNLSYFMSDFIRKKIVPPGKPGELLFAPYDVILDQNIIVQPDILYISHENRINIKKSGFFGAPDLVIEVVSPSSLKIDTEDKKNIYKKFGVKEYWIIFPNEEIIQVFTLSKGTYTNFDYASTENIVGEQKVKSKVIEGLVIDLKNIF
jgi:Uma2 family endonuclease